MLGRYEVKGNSMEPSFRDGDRVLVRSFLFSPKAGDAVVFRDRGTDLLKRISEVRDGKYFLCGENRSHSRRYVAAGSPIQGKVIMKYGRSK